MLCYLGQVTQFLWASVSAMIIREGYSGWSLNSLVSSEILSCKEFQGCKPSHLTTTLLSLYHHAHSVLTS